MSGNNTEADRLRLQQAGMDACLHKPFRAEELKSLLGRFASQKATAAEAPAKRSAPSREAATPEADLLARVGGDPALLLRVIHTFLKDRPKKIAALRRALAQRDAPALAAAAHAIKGPIAIFAAAQAKALAEQLQVAAHEGQLAECAKFLLRLEEEIANLEKKLRGYTAQASRAQTPSAQRTPRAKTPAKTKARRASAKR